MSTAQFAEVVLKRLVLVVLRLIFRASMNDRPVGPEEESFVDLVTGPKGPGWENGWPVGPQDLPNDQIT